MITLEPYTIDAVAYSRLPARHRWIFNKLELALRLDQPAGPCGTRAPRGDLCVRPVINVTGMGYGGFFKVPHNEGGLTKARPGYFWSPWIDGEHRYIYYVKDKPWYYVVGTIDDDGRLKFEEVNPKRAPKLPRPLRGISRYMGLQTIDAVVIEVAPRHSAIRPKVIADYQKIKPGYVPKNLYTLKREVPESFALQGQVLERVKNDPYGMVGWEWLLDETADTPFKDKWG